MAPNSVSILILKHRHELVTDCHQLESSIGDCPIIGPDCECCRLIGQAVQQCCPTFTVPRAAYLLILRPRAAIVSGNKNLVNIIKYTWMPLMSMKHSPLVPYCLPNHNDDPQTIGEVIIVEI